MSVCFSVVFGFGPRRGAPGWRRGEPALHAAFTGAPQRTPSLALSAWVGAGGGGGAGGRGGWALVSGRAGSGGGGVGGARGRLGSALRTGGWREAGKGEAGLCLPDGRVGGGKGRQGSAFRTGGWGEGVGWALPSGRVGLGPPGWGEGLGGWARPREGGPRWPGREGAGRPCRTGRWWGRGARAGLPRACTGVGVGQGSAQEEESGRAGRPRGRPGRSEPHGLHGPAVNHGSREVRVQSSTFVS